MNNVLKRVNLKKDSNDEKRVFLILHSRFTSLKEMRRPKQCHSKLFNFSKSGMLWLQHKNDSSLNIPNTGGFPFISKTNLQKEPMRFNFRGKSSSSDFKTQKETPSFSNNFQQKKSFESSLIPRVSFQNVTKFFSPRWNSTSFIGLTQLSNLIFRHSLLHNT